MGYIKADSTLITADSTLFTADNVSTRYFIGTGARNTNSTANWSYESGDAAWAYIGIFFEAGKNYTVGSFITVNGTASAPIILKSLTSAVHNLIKTGTGLVNVEYCDISYSNASPVNTFFATNTTDSGNNVNWNFNQLGVSIEDIEYIELESVLAAGQGQIAGAGFGMAIRRTV